MAKDDGFNLFMTWVGGPLVFAIFSWFVVSAIGCVARGPTSASPVYSFTHEGVVGFWIGYFVGLALLVTDWRSDVAREAELRAMYHVTFPGAKPGRLRKCVECGGLVSSTLGVCPHCKESADGIRCVLCGSLSLKSQLATQPQARSGSWTSSGLYEEGTGTLGYYHPGCLNDLLGNCFEGREFKLVCSECNYIEYWSGKHPTKELLHRAPRHNCPKCGCKAAFCRSYREYGVAANADKCARCGFLIYWLSQAHCLSVWNGLGDRKLETESYHYPDCAPKRRPPGRYLLVFNRYRELKKQIGRKL